MSVLIKNATGSTELTSTSATNDVITLPSGTGTLLKTDGDGSGLTGIAGTVVQIVNFQTGTAASGTTTTPLDDSIPQNTEGTEFMTLAVTPTSATNRLKIDVVFLGHSSSSVVMAAALFQDTTASALAVGKTEHGADQDRTIGFSHNMSAGTTSATTFKVRAGGNNAGTTAINGRSARIYGGTLASSITITEYTP